MDMPMPVRSLSCALFLLLAACASKNDGNGAQGTGPAGQSGVSAYCDALCGRAMTCAASSAPPPEWLASCDSNCKMNLATDPLQLLRADTLNAVAQCASGVDCSTLQSQADFVAALTKCRADTFAATSPTEAAQSLCGKAAGMTVCIQGLGTDCLDNAKVYNEGTLQTLSGCLDRPCNEQQDCWNAALKPSG
jgi:hypothetical protein